MKKIKNVNKRFKKEKTYKYLILAILFCCLLILTIGWSAFLQKLYINDLSVRVDAKKDIRVTSIVSDGTTNGGTILSQDYNTDKIFADITLPNENSTASFIVEVTNYGNIEMGILKIDNLPENLEMVIEEYNLEEKICGTDRCNLGIKKEIKITFKYKDNGYDASKETYNLNLDVDFRAFHNVTYENVNGSNLPNEVIDGGTLKATLDSSISKNNLEVYVDNKQITEFNLESNILEVTDVTGDVRVVYKNVSEGALYAFMKDQSLGTDKDIDFTSSNITSGVYLHEETKDDPYPVYYYRGSVTNNNVYYANYWWKIVRTTENGGIKLIYNHQMLDGKSNPNHEYLGSEAFNKKINVNGKDYPSPSQVGYMYGDVRIIEKVAPSYLDDTNHEVVKPGTIFGNDVTYDNGKYTLVDTIVVNNLNNLEDDIRGGSSHGGIGHHYTCLSLEASCEKVYYIYYDDYGNENDSGAEGLFGMALDNGLNVTQTLDKLLFKSSNENSSYAKTYLDNFFEGSGGDFDRAGGDKLIDHYDKGELDDVQWCNDRTIAGYHGWDLNNDNHVYDNKYLHFKAFGRLVGDEGIQVVTRPDITCDDINDTFTVSTSNGNGKLKNPIGLLTADEAVLAGVIEDVNTNSYLNMNASKHQLLMTPYYVSDDHIRMFVISNEGKLYSSYASNDNAIRPVIALKSNAYFSSGDGSIDNPYIISFN